MILSMVEVLRLDGKSLFTTDARLGLEILLVLSAIVIIVTAIIVFCVTPASERHDLHHIIDSNTFATFSHGEGIVFDSSDDAHSRLFAQAIVLTLVIAFPSVIDRMLTFFLLKRPLTAFGEPMEYTLLYIIRIIALPNLFIFFQLVPVSVIDLVMFCQYLCVFFSLVYRIFTLASIQPKLSIQPVSDLFALGIFTLIAACLYKLSTCQIIRGKLALKASFTLSLLVLQALTCYKIMPWFNFSLQRSKLVKNHLLLQNKIAFSAVMIGLGVCVLLTVLHVILFPFDYVYFPTNIQSFVTFQWTWCVVLISWKIITNFEMRKVEYATADQLEYNRKMTRSISHEIRTPLNTAFMALELLLSTLKQSPSSLATASQDLVVDQRVPPVADTVGPMPPNSSFRRDSGLKLDSSCYINTNTNNLLEIAESIKEGCDIALNILNQLLTFEKLSAGMLQLENKVITVNELLDSNMKLFRMQAQQCGITFKLDRSNVNADQMFVFVDEHKMNQVLRNLLSNAMKFTPRGGVVEVKLQWITSNERDVVVSSLSRREKAQAPTKSRAASLFMGKFVTNGDEDEDFSQNHKLWDKIKHRIMRLLRWCGFVAYPHAKRSISKEDEDSTTRSINLKSNAPLHHPITGMKTSGTILVSVIDSGPGVGSEDQRKLFREYVQINPGELQKGQGTGLGLSISKSIVHLHGGNIGMSSEGIGKGSTFYIELPAYRSLREEAGTRISDNTLEALDHSRVGFTGFLGRAPSRRFHVNKEISGSSLVSNHSNDHVLDEHNAHVSHFHQPARLGMERMESFMSAGGVGNGGGRHNVSRVDREGGGVGGGIESGASRYAGIVGTDFTDYNEMDADPEEGRRPQQRPKPFLHSADETSNFQPLTDVNLMTRVADIFRNIFLSTEHQHRTKASFSSQGPSRNGSGKVVPVVPLSTEIQEDPLTTPIDQSRSLSHGVSHNEENHGSADVSKHDTNYNAEKLRTSSSIAPTLTSPLCPAQDFAIIQSNARQPLRALRILVVDDSAPNRKMLGRLLTREHHVVIEASDGSEAVMIMQDLIRDRENAQALIDYHRMQSHQTCSKERTSFGQFSDTTVSFQQSCEARPPLKDLVNEIEIPQMFDIILMDYYMTSMNGPTAISAIRKLGYEGMIVGISGLIDDDVEDFMQAGADLVLCKPITLASLWKALRATNFFANNLIQSHKQQQNANENISCSILVS